MIKYLSLFSGVGSPEMALRNLGIEFELVGFSEVDKYAIKSYCAIHGVDESLNLGDITKIDVDALPDDIDLITHGSPCQDFSFAGKRQGGDEGSGTRSSLMWNTVEIIRKKKPKCVIWENVKGVLSKKHIHNFEKYLQTMSDEGYKNYYKVLNAKDYGIPQNRERIFIISILGDHDEYKFPSSKPLDICLEDVLEDEVDDKYYLPKIIQNRFTEFPAERMNNEHLEVVGTTALNPYRADGSIIYDKCTSAWVYNPSKCISTLSARDYKQPKQILVPQSNKNGFIELNLPGMCDLSYPSSTSRRGRVQGGGKICPCLTAANGRLCFIKADNGPGINIRKLTPREYWRLMGFSDSDYNKAAEVCSNTQLYKQAGNSIVVNVMEAIFKNIYDK